MCIANICSQHFKVQKCIKTTFDGIQKLPIMMILSLSREDNVSHSPVAKPMEKNYVSMSLPPQIHMGI